MIKNLNTTLTIISFIVLIVFSIKVGFGFLLSSHHSSSLKDNWNFFKDYVNNQED